MEPEGAFHGQRMGVRGPFQRGLRDGSKRHRRKRDLAFPRGCDLSGAGKVQSVHSPWSVCPFTLGPSAQASGGLGRSQVSRLCSLPAPAARTLVTRALGVVLTLYQV